MGSKMSKSASIYTPLRRKSPQIRLLRFHTPFVRDTQIKLTLFKASLDSNPNFVALSYEWGDASNLEDILVNGTPLPVTRNLVSALKEMGSQFSDQTFWVDAISINQADVEERNHQVTLMRRIYQQAAMVFSWLGEAHEGSRRAVKLLRTLNHAWFNRIGDEIEDTAKELDLERLDGLDDLWQELGAGIHALNALFTRPYWERVWILQETMLAKHLICVCGPDTFSFDQIAMASVVILLASRTSGLFKLDTLFFLQHSSVVEILRRISSKPSSINTAVVFSYARACRATDPRDYIYGLLGLIDIDVQPDYSMSTRDVYCNLARSWIMQTLRLDFMKFAGTAFTLEKTRTEGLPTWVPDWRALSECYQDPCSVMFNASGGMPAEARVSTDLSTVWLTGVRCDEIKSVVPYMPVVPHIPDASKVPQRIADYYWSMILNPDEVNAYSKGMTRLEAIFWLFFQDEYEELRGNLDKFRRYVFFYSSILSMTNNIEGLLAQLPPHESNSKIEEFCQNTTGDIIHLRAILGLCMRFGESAFGDLDAVLPLLKEMTEMGTAAFNTDVNGNNIMASSSLRGTDAVAFHTSKGHVGMLRHCLANHKLISAGDGEPRPANVILPGDVVCVLSGHDYPVVLRRKDSHFILIGVCSVFGFMDGEAMELVRAGVAHSEVFEIR